MPLPLFSQGAPPSPRFQGEFAASASLLASLLLEAGRPREALASIDAVLPSYEQFIRDEPAEGSVGRRREVPPYPDL